MPMNPRLLRPTAAGGFDPRRISGLVAWYDANVSTSITISTGVSNWANLEGTATRDLQQSTGNNQPLVVTGFNGKSAIQFNGTSHFLARTFSHANPCHEFVVCRVDVGSKSNAITDGGTFGRKLLYATSSNGLIVYQGQNGPVSGNNIFTAGTPFLADSEFANANSVGRFNGTQYGTGNAGAGVPNGMTVGRWPGIAQYGEVSVAEIILYERILSTAEAARVRRYLGGKYGITIT